MNNFKRLNFFPLNNNLYCNEIEKLLDGQVKFINISKNFSINEVSSLSYYRDNSIIFLEKDFFDQSLIRDDIFIISNNPLNKNFYKNIVIVSDINISYNKVLNHLYKHEDKTGFTDEYNHINGSYISKFSKLDTSCEIGKNCVISRGVEIGKNTVIKNNVVIKNSIIKNDVIICDNTSLGTTGFGFDLKKRGSAHLNPQVGIVYINDNVHIGSSCTIDRGKIDTTYIGKNSMIDNMVHIAHNVVIGDNACIAAQTGISGSVKIGNSVTVGGQVGFAGHLTIGENVIIAAKSGITKNIKDNSVVAGFPAIDMKEWKKNVIRQKKNGH